jgi:LL-diaminopimelate aminotransferase
MLRTDCVSEYLFARIDQKLKGLRAAGVDVISFGVGDPVSPPPQALLDRLAGLVGRHDLHNYSPYEGTAEFRAAGCDYLRRRYGATVDPETQAVGLIGSKEGIANLFMAYTRAGTVNLVPSLAYPIPATMTRLGEGEVFSLPVDGDHGFLPDLDRIPGDVLDRARLLYLNYPNNPTGVGAPLEYLAKALDLARRHDLLIVHDCAYEEIWFHGRPRSFLELPGGLDHVVEFHSLSKMFNITGWRLAFVAGAERNLAPLKVMKTNTDSGQFKPLQLAAAWALGALVDEFGAHQRETYRRRMTALAEALQRVGARARISDGTFFLWGRVPEGFDSSSFTEHLLDRAGVFVTPGVLFGADGEGYFRASLTVSDDRLADAVDRLGRMG